MLWAAAISTEARTKSKFKLIVIWIGWWFFFFLTAAFVFQETKSAINIFYYYYSSVHLKKASNAGPSSPSPTTGPCSSPCSSPHGVREACTKASAEKYCQRQGNYLNDFAYFFHWPLLLCLLSLLSFVHVHSSVRLVLLEFAFENYNHILSVSEYSTLILFFFTNLLPLSRWLRW